MSALHPPCRTSVPSLAVPGGHRTAVDDQTRCLRPDSLSSMAVAATTSSGLPMATNGSSGSSTRVSATTTISWLAPEIAISLAADSAFAMQVTSVCCPTPSPPGGSGSGEDRARDSTSQSLPSNRTLSHRFRRCEADASRIDAIWDLRGRCSLRTQGTWPHAHPAGFRTCNHTLGTSPACSVVAQADPEAPQVRLYLAQAGGRA